MGIVEKGKTMEWLDRPPSGHRGYFGLDVHCLCGWSWQPALFTTARRKRRELAKHYYAVTGEMR